MTQNPNLAGAAEAIERTKNAANETGVRDAFDKVSEGAQQAYADTSQAVMHATHEAYDFVGDTFRAGEDYTRRKPIQALAAATMVGALIGFCFAVRAAPRASKRDFSSWR